MNWLFSPHLYLIDIVREQEKIIDWEIELWAKETNYKEHSLECSTVCSRNLGIN